MTPPSLGDTWAADNLSKIDHIVVVMMENRSFDHVLGYRQLIGDVDGDGGYRDLIAFLYDQGFPVTLLRNSGIIPDCGRVQDQVSGAGGPPSQATSRSNLRASCKRASARPSTVRRDSSTISRVVPRPPGFSRRTSWEHTTATISPSIGFSPKTTPTASGILRLIQGRRLPNRMYSLGGDVQYDRVGEAILDNNNSDNFALSRASNIFDLLTRKNVSWRVYESFPSITMLRMFARYVGDNTNILPIANLNADIAAGNLPSVTFIDPAMHHAPENDDHPVADMLYGQIFLKSIYDDLRANEALWLRTLLIISYDEHGGFYDHVVPPPAEIRWLPSPFTLAATSDFRAALDHTVRRSSARVRRVALGSRRERARTSRWIIVRF